jgi:hypothetical protein
MSKANLLPQGGFNRCVLARNGYVLYSIVNVDARHAAAGAEPGEVVENDREDTSEALIRHLLDLDYRLYWHLPPLYNPQNFVGETENVSPNIVSVNMLCLPRSLPQSIQGMPEVVDPTQHPMKRLAG